MKAYTDVNQSKKLAKILPLDSADSVIVSIGDREGVKTITIPKETFNILRTPFTDIRNTISCWSLAALLSVIPKHIKDYNVLRIDISNNNFAIWYDEIGFGVNSELPDITMKSAIDACVDMIIKLKEMNLI